MHLQQADKLSDLALSEMVLADIIEPSAPTTPAESDIVLRTTASDMTLPGIAEQLAADEPDLIYHLAAKYKTNKAPPPSTACP